MTNTSQMTQVAVITGGAQGIGWATADDLAARGFYTVILDTGASLDGAGREPRALVAARQRLAARGHEGEVVPCDVRDADACHAVIDRLVARFGGIDVLVNVAGILRPGPFLEDTPETWDLVMATHVGGHLNLIAAALPSMMARPTARIVNFTSTAGLLGSRRQPAYATAKEAIVGLTRFLARQLTGSAVTVNAVSPGAATRMSVGLREPDGPEADRSPGLSERDPSDVGAFIGWLTGKEAANVTGRVFMVSGRYVIEYEDLRPWKWAGAPVDSGEPVGEVIRWVLGRPHPAMIGPWPTRDFKLLEQARPFEGTTTGPNLVDDDPQRCADQTPTEAIAVIGDPATSALNGGALRTAGLRTISVSEAGSGTAAGAIAYLDAPPRPPSPEVIPEAAAQCRALSEALRRVQASIRMTRRHSDRGIVVLLPGNVPWSEAPAPATWLQWYGAVGLVRGAAATEGIYGVRVNGLITAPGSDRLAAAVAKYLLSPESSWLNGYLVTADAGGIGVLADERPGWQVYTGGDGFDPLLELGFLPVADAGDQRTERGGSGTVGEHL